MSKDRNECEVTEIERMAYEMERLFIEAEIKQTLPKKHPSIVRAEALYNAGYRKQSEVEYWKQQYFHSCVRNGCVDEKVIEYLLTNAEGHNDTVGEDGVEGEDGQGNLNPLYRMQKADVAREIFEEIEKCMEHDYISSIDVFSVALGLRIAELKKKYTEEKT